MTRPSTGAEGERPETTPERHRRTAGETRRAALAVVSDAARPVSLEDLVSAIDDARDGETAGGRDRRAIAAELHHVHVPKLARAGAVDYDASANRVELTGRETGVSVE